MVRRCKPQKKAPTCGCRPPKRHRDCAYCGVFPSGKVCGVCKEGGVDGATLPGTSRVTCKLHKNKKGKSK